MEGRTEEVGEGRRENVVTAAQQEEVEGWSGGGWNNICDHVVVVDIVIVAVDVVVVAVDVVVVNVDVDVVDCGISN